MEKITVTKIIKVKPSKFGFSTMVKTTEYGETRIYMLSTKSEDGIKVGQTCEGHGELWKKGEDGVEFWSWKWPRKDGVASPEVMKALEEINNRTLKTHLLVEELVADFRKRDKPKITGTDIPYPTREDEGLDQIDESQIPF